MFWQKLLIKWMLAHREESHENERSVLQDASTVRTKMFGKEETI